MNWFSLSKCMAEEALRNTNRICAQVLELLRALVTVSDDLEKLAIKPANVTLLGTGQCYRICDYGIQHRLNVGWRAGDDAENLARGRLLLQSLSEITVAGIEFIK